MGEECGKTSSLIGGIRCSTVAMAYASALVRGWKIKMAGKTVPGFVLKTNARGGVGWGGARNLRCSFLYIGNGFSSYIFFACRCRRMAEGCGGILL